MLKNGINNIKLHVTIHGNDKITLFLVFKTLCISRLKTGQGGV